MAIGTSIKVSLDTKAVAKGFAKIRAGFKRLGKNISAAGRAMLLPFAKLAAILAPIMGAAAAFKIGKDSIFAAATYEETVLLMEQFTGSAEKAKSILDDLTTFSLKTPFETKDLQDAAAAFLGAGIQDGVPKLVKDVAAVAKNGPQIMELTDALSKGFAKGKFQTEEINKFLERQINLLPELRKVTGLSGEEFQRAVEAGLKFEDVTKAISNLSKEGGQFYNLLEKRSKTTVGLTSTLKSGFTELQKVFGQPLNDAIKPILDSAIANVSDFLPRVEALGKKVGDSIKVAFAVFKTGNIKESLLASMLWAGSRFIEELMAGMGLVAQALNDQLGNTDIGNFLGFRSFTPDAARGGNLWQGPDDLQGPQNHGPVQRTVSRDGRQLRQGKRTIRHRSKVGRNGGFAGAPKMDEDHGRD